MIYTIYIRARESLIKGVNMKTFKNKNYFKRDYECTNVIACVAEKAPNDNYIECDAFEIEHLKKLYTENGITYYGYL